jgi:hypothetical protein
LAWIGSDAVSGGGADAAKACRAGVASVDDLFRFLSEWSAPGILKLGILRGKDLVEFDLAPAEAE